MAYLKELVKVFDALGWVPTIRGSLSLDLIGNGKNLLGDVDKYAIEFAKHTELSTSHYIAATSLITVNDTKVGSDIYRSFRYMFVGAISDDEYGNNFIRKYSITNTDVQLCVKKGGVLLGQLVIVTEDGKNFSTYEAEMLERMRDLANEREKYVISSAVKAVQMSELATIRTQMYNSWNDVLSCIKEIANNEERDLPTYCFDVALTRDGILLLKDVTKDKYKDSYCKSGTPDDYTQNVPIHRIFKVSMNYIKYLFHVNYHHNVEHDAFLPASNLHPSRHKTNFDLGGVFRHQLNAFLNPITRMKRNGFADYTMDVNGVLLYAKAFVKVFKENGLINKCDADKADSFIELQKNEIDHMTQSSRILMNAVMSQHNWLLVFSGVLAFVVAFIKLATSFVEIDRLKISEMSSPEGFGKICIYAIFVVALFAVGYILYYVSHSIVLSKRFIRKRQNVKIYFGNSNTKKKKLALTYRLVIWLHTQKLIMGIVLTELVKVVFWLLLMIIASMFIYFWKGI